jgi:ABC-type transport system involved in multi-copper enzyme maturation permease subunit
MFKTLLIKEWKDKALLTAFGLGIMGLMLASFLLFGNDQDLRELIPATFLIFFFPVIGAMLGAGAFESEFRDGAWTYLLSRPVRKETIWSAKLAALLSILAGFWLVFIGLMAVVPGLGDVIAGFNLPKIVGSGLSLFPLILLSLLLLSIASLSSLRINSSASYSGRFFSASSWRASCSSSLSGP